MASVIGSTRAKASTPTAGTRTRRISSLAYAVDDRASLANTARAVGLPSRSWASWSLSNGWPSSFVFQR